MRISRMEVGTSGIEYANVVEVSANKHILINEAWLQALPKDSVS